MGNRTALSFGECCEFEANNCLPVTWLSLFSQKDLTVETRRFEYEKVTPQKIIKPPSGLRSAIKRLLGREKHSSSKPAANVETRETLYEEAQVAVYQTSRATALERVESAILSLEGKTPIWTYLRPLEILRDELQHCQSGNPVELDVTQFYWARDPVYQQRILDGPSAFAHILESLTGEEHKDLGILNHLVNDYSMGAISSLADLDAEDRMFVLIGTYWGEREEIYTLEYFEDYWSTSS